MRKSNCLSRRRLIGTMITIALLIGAVLLNLLVSLLPYGATHFVLSDSTTFLVSRESLDWVASVEEDVTISLICEGGKHNADPDLYAFLSRYAEASDHITVQIVDPERDAAFLADRGATKLSDLSVIVESKYRTRLIDSAQLYYYLNSTYQMMMSASEYEEYLAYFQQYDSTGSYAATFASLTVPYFDGDFYVINAIKFVTQPKLSVAYTLVGSGAALLESALIETLALDAYDQRTLASLAQIPADCDVLIIHAPTIDLTEQEATTLSAYLANGGRLFLVTNYENGILTRLDTVLREYGLSFGDTDALVCDEQNVLTGFSEMVKSYFGLTDLFPDPFASYLTGSNIFGNVNCSYLNWLSHEIKLSETEGVAVASLIKTSDQGYLARYDEENQEWGKLVYDEASGKWVKDEEKIEHRSYCIGATAKKGETEILWISSPTSLTSLCNSYSEEGGNFAFACAVLDAMSGNTNTVLTPAAKPFNVTAFQPTEDQRTLWGILLVIVLPAVPALIGVFKLISRRKR